MCYCLGCLHYDIVLFEDRAWSVQKATILTKGLVETHGVAGLGTLFNVNIEVCGKVKICDSGNGPCPSELTIRLTWNSPIGYPKVVLRREIPLQIPAKFLSCVFIFVEWSKWKSSSDNCNNRAATDNTPPVISIRVIPMTTLSL